MLRTVALVAFAASLAFWAIGPSLPERRVLAASGAAQPVSDLPRLLSETGYFADLRLLKPVASFRLYDVNVPFWSDGADKRRWIALPPGASIHLAEGGRWDLPRGTVLLKHFERPPGVRLETRVLLYDGSGHVHGASYRWRPDGADAERVDEATFGPAALGQGLEDSAQWSFPGVRDCQTCHTQSGGGVLGVTARQLNMNFGPGGRNQLAEWADAGMFDAKLPALATLPRLARGDDESRSLEDRARSYLDANCSNCHRPQGVAGQFDARFETPLRDQNVVGGPVLINLGLDHARVIAPADPWRSLALVRIETKDKTRMPPLAHERVDKSGAELLRRWIASLPGRPVLPPPSFSLAGGEYPPGTRITLETPSPGITIRYTMDGSLPMASSPAYAGPLTLSEPATLRARCFREGYTPSIAALETYIITP